MVTSEGDHSFESVRDRIRKPSNLALDLYRVQQIACRAISASAELLVDFLATTATTTNRYVAPERGAKYCDERAYLSVCLSVRSHISKITWPNFTKFLTICLTLVH